MNVNVNARSTTEETWGDGLWAKQCWLSFGPWYLFHFFFSIILVICFFFISFVFLLQGLEIHLHLKPLFFIVLIVLVTVL